MTAGTWDLEGETIPTWFDLLIFEFLDFLNFWRARLSPHSLTFDFQFFRFFEFLEGETIPTWFDF